MGKFSKWIDLAIILLVVNSVQYNFEKNYPNELPFEKKILTLNWQCQFDVWTWFAEG